VRQIQHRRALASRFRGNDNFFIAREGAQFFLVRHRRISLRASASNVLAFWRLGGSAFVEYQPSDSIH
jgi:hypothetical protein